MRVTIYLSDAEGLRLEQLADQEHRTVRQQATVLVLQALGLLTPTSTQPRETVAA
jgi:hypothetical protein